MNKKSHYLPRLVKIADKYGDDLTPPCLTDDRAALRTETVWEDLQAARHRPIDAPMAASLDSDDATVVAPDYHGRVILTLLLIAISFIAGLSVGRVL